MTNNLGAKRGWLERWLDRHNHKMELLRTGASLLAALGSLLVLLKIYDVI